MKKPAKEYVKLVILSTLTEAKPLVAIGKEWFNNTGRFFHKEITGEIQKAVEDGILSVENKRFYKANSNKLLDKVINSISLGDDKKLAEKYKKYLRHFYLDEKIREFTQKTYLDDEIITILTGRDSNKAEDLKWSYLVQLPILFFYLRERDEALYNIVVQILGLEEYVKLVQHLEWKHVYILQESRCKEEWAETFNNLQKLLPKLQKKGAAMLDDNKGIVTLFGK